MYIIIKYSRNLYDFIFYILQCNTDIKNMILIIIYIIIYM